jgi:hypothetical protein
MSPLTKLGFGLVAVGLFVCVVGCAKDTPPAATPATTTEDAPATPPSATDGAATTPAEGDQAAAAKIEANLASFPAEDRALALKQKICPVSGEALGSMGPPIKLNVAGHDVFICCEGCEDPLVSDPAKHLAKIGLQAAEEAAVQ